MVAEGEDDFPLRTACWLQSARKLLVCEGSCVLFHYGRAWEQGVDDGFYQMPCEIITILFRYVGFCLVMLPEHA